MTDNERFRPTPWRLFSTRFSYMLLPGHCKLCKSDSMRSLDLCALCESDLPDIGDHCNICSEPSANPWPKALAKPLTCGNCLNRTPYFSHAHIPYLYKAPIDRLLISFKFKGDLVAGKVLGKLLSQHIEQCIKHDLAVPQAIIPVPLHWWRRLGRGFNQAHELAMTLSKHLNIPVNNKLVLRKTHTSAQHHLNREQRLHNLRDAFSVSRYACAEQIEGKSFAIVDDVLTTGSTANAIAKLLIDNGAARVVVWAVARAALEN
ncbi:MAG: ComF family protein [Porticoccaceae bacterium]|nr:ComF family protein [Porticoccaceae bacterium]